MSNIQVQDAFGRPLSDKKLFKLIAAESGLTVRAIKKVFKNHRELLLEPFAEDSFDIGMDILKGGKSHD